MTVKMINDVMVIEAENEDETQTLKEWRERKKKKTGKWLEVRYYQSIKVLVI